MKRRTMILGSIATLAGASGLVGYRIGISEGEEYFGLEQLIKNNPGVNLSHLSVDTLMKIHDGKLTLADAPTLEDELLRYNRLLYAPSAVGRHLGEPGFYGIK